MVEALGWPVTVKQLSFKSRYEYGKPWFRASFSHLQEEARSDLRSPWPDLVIAVGRRPAMVAMEIKRRSQGRSKIILIGRPRHRRAFDLAVAPAHLLVPDQHGICRVPWPLIRLSGERVARSSERWSSQIDDLPRPLTAVLVGGATVPYAFGPGQARELVTRVREATGGEGCAYFCTSRRTGARVTAELQSCLSADASAERLFAWTADAAANPYLALLGLADRFVVTGDSLSMMLEVAQVGKPLALHVPPLGLRPRSLLAPCSKRFLYRFDPTTQRLEPRGLTNALFRVGLINYARDLGAIHHGLLRSGRAALLGEGFSSRPEPLDLELERVVQRVNELVGACGP